MTPRAARAAPRSPLPALVALATFIALLALPAPPAGAAESAPLLRAPRGVVPDVPTGTRLRLRPRAVARAANLPWAGGPVMHSNRTHVIFWQPAGSGLSFEANYIPLIEQFLQRVAADSRKPTNVYGLSGQYTDSSGPAAYESTYGGSVVATDPLPSNGCTEPAPPPPAIFTGPGWSRCVNDGQIQSEITRVISANHLPTGSREIYFLVTPNGLGSCAAGGPDNCALGGSANKGAYCGYHSATFDGRVLYAIIPFNAVPGHCQSDNPRPNGSTADPTISTLSHEHNEVVTDPLPQNPAWIDNQGNENGDLCATEFGNPIGGSGVTAYNQVIAGGHYYLQGEWSNDERSCQLRDEANPISFKVPKSVPGDRAVTLNGTASDPDGRIVSYRWSFSDGGGGTEHKVSHTFRTVGTHTVTFRITDLSGNQASLSQPVNVAVPPAPVPRITRKTVGSRARFRFDSTAAIASYGCRLDSGRWSLCRSPFTTGRLARGRHRFSVMATDIFGQVARRPATYGFRVA
jgi:hypothetical protein